MKRAHKGTMQLVERKSGLQVWVYRWFEKDQAGEPWRRKRALGAITRFKSETAAWREVERLGLGRSFDESGPRNLKELVDHYTQKELDTEPGKERLAFATSETYRLMLKNWVMPRWGTYPLDDIKAVAVEEWLGKLQRTVGEEKIDLAPGSKKKIRDVMHVLFKHAIRYEWMDRNPIAAVRQGGERRLVPELIEVSDLSRLIFEVLSLRERVMIFLGFGTGLRRGELGGIKWEDIDFETGQLHPRRSIVRQHVGKTKTEASRNIIPVDEHLLADLRAWRMESPYAENGDYIFASPKMKGKQPLWLDTVIKKIIKPAAAKTGIRLKGWHTLRHTYSTLLKANGNDPKVVQELLRHAKLATTMDGYTQALSPDKRRAHRGVIRLVVPRQVPRKLVAALSD